MLYVIGSGPAGISCASALLSRGYKVTMLDAGVTLASETQSLLSTIQTKWDDALIKSLKHQLNTQNPIKLSYNSHYPYEAVNDHYPIEADNEIHCMPSFAEGGLSNVWGAFVEKYQEEEFASWPIQASQLAPYYQAIATFLPHATINTEGNFYRQSRQAQHLLKHFSLHQQHLKNAGFEYQAATLAVNFAKQGNTFCQYCANCQHGCPLNLIYSARHTLDTLKKSENFFYIGNTVVDRLHETTKGVDIMTHHLRSKEKLNYHGRYVFIACGPLLSTALVLKTMNRENHKVRFYDSSHFMLPALMFKRIPKVEQEKLHTLAQLSMKLKLPSSINKQLNLQIYTYMDHYTEKFKQLFKSGYPLAAPILRPLIDRFIVLQGHLNSADSHQFDLHINDNKLFLTSVINPTVENTLNNMLSTLYKNKKPLGFIPLTFLLQTSKIGRSFHYGGSMPMTHNPIELQTDVFGKLKGYQRLHIVDGSIFPSIAAGSYTPTIMANAYRIGMETQLNDT